MPKDSFSLFQALIQGNVLCLKQVRLQSTLCIEIYPTHIKKGVSGINDVSESLGASQGIANPCWAFRVSFKPSS